MTDPKRQYGQRVVDELGQDAVVAHSIPPDARVVRGESLSTLPRIVKIFDLMQVRQDPPLYGTVKLLEIAVELVGGLKTPPSCHLSISPSSAASGRLRPPPAAKASIAASAA